MAEITSSPTVSIQSLLYPTTTDTQTTTQTTQSSPTVTTTVVPTDTSLLPSSSRGYSAATLGLTPPRPGGSAEADLLMVRQMIEDMNNENRDTEIMASTQRKATALGGALALLGGMVSSMAEAIALTVEQPYAKAKAEETLAEYQVKQKATSEVNEKLTPVKAEFDKLTGDIAAATKAIQDIDRWIGEKNTALEFANTDLSVANFQLSGIRDNIDSKNREIISLQTQLAAATNPSVKKSLQEQILYAQGVLNQFKTQESDKLKDIGGINTRIEQLNKEKTDLQSSRQERVNQITAAQTRLDEITPTKVQLEADLAAAKKEEEEAGAVYYAAKAYYDGLQPRIDQAFADFDTTLAGFTLMANRLAAVPGMPDAGVDTELAVMRKENKEALAELWKIMSDSREKLGAEARINDAINSKLKDVDEVTRTKIGLAFTSVFSALQDAFKSLAALLDPASNSGGSNFSERQPQRMRFAIGGSA